jgi:hypothetical protein
MGRVRNIPKVASSENRFSHRDRQIALVDGRQPQPSKGTVGHVRLSGLPPVDESPVEEYALTGGLICGIGGLNAISNGRDGRERYQGGHRGET